MTIKHSIQGLFIVISLLFLVVISSSKVFAAAATKSVSCTVTVGSMGTGDICNACSCPADFPNVQKNCPTDPKSCGKAKCVCAANTNDLKGTCDYDGATSQYYCNCSTGGEYSGGSTCVDASSKGKACTCPAIQTVQPGDPCDLAAAGVVQCGGTMACVKDPTTGKGICTATSEPINFCTTAGADQAKCNDCLINHKGVFTALGCISYDPTTFIQDFLKLAIGIAGGIAFLLMIYGAFLVSISAGDPKKADEGKELITGTIAGLLFIIFSVVLLKLIGVDILQIPGF